MLTLVQVECDPVRGNMLRAIRPDYSEIYAVAWIHGAGPWDGFLERVPGAASQISYLFRNGHTILIDTGSRQADQPLDHTLAIVEAVKHHFKHLPLEDIAKLDCCVILREGSYIALLPDGPNVYVVDPQGRDMSAHELMRDAAALDLDFPGIFRFQV